MLTWLMDVLVVLVVCGFNDADILLEVVVLVNLLGLLV